MSLTEDDLMLQTIVSALVVAVLFGLAVEHLLPATVVSPEPQVAEEVIEA